MGSLEIMSPSSQGQKLSPSTDIILVLLTFKSKDSRAEHGNAKGLLRSHDDSVFFEVKQVGE